MAAMTEDQRDSLRNSLDAAYSGTGNAGKILVLEGDFEWKRDGPFPKDLDFAAGKKYVCTRNCPNLRSSNLVGVPGYYIL